MRCVARVMVQAALAMAAAILLVASPAAAQFTDSYNFIKAVKDKDGAKAQEILDKPGTTIVNTRDSDTGDTGLHIAVKRGDAAWVGFLLQKGASANARDRDGNTPLMIAAQTRWTDGVQIFVQIKAQIDVQNRLGETALMKAVQGRDANMAKLLIESGANPDLTDNSGISARALAETDPRASQIAKLFKDLPVRKARPAQGPSL
jgi:ankyrin repeat protein